MHWIDKNFYNYVKPYVNYVNKDKKTIGQFISIWPCEYFPNGSNWTYLRFSKAANNLAQNLKYFLGYTCMAIGFVGFVTITTMKMYWVRLVSTKDFLKWIFLR